jgi:hypothetical protein
MTVALDQALSHTHTHTHTNTRSVGLPWTRNRPVAAISTGIHVTFKRNKYICSPAGFEPAIPASEQPQTHASDRAVIGFGT